MMRNLIALGLLTGLAGMTLAGPFGLLGRRGGNYYPAQGNATQSNSGGLWTAQDSANYQASIGRMGHYGNPTGGYEGVGMGGSPQAAIQNCCFYGRRPLRDQGVAQGANGQWYACCRYN